MLLAMLRLRRHMGMDRHAGSVQVDRYTCRMCPGGAVRHCTRRPFSPFPLPIFSLAEEHGRTDGCRIDFASPGVGLPLLNPPQARVEAGGTHTYDVLCTGLERPR